MSRDFSLNRITRRLVLALGGGGVASAVAGTTAAANRIGSRRSVLKDLYDSEINFSIVTLWHGMDVTLGDYLNGICANTHVLQWEEAEAWLEREAIKHFPDSQFALIYRDGHAKDDAERQ
jgi:hypothetical protein